MSSIPYDPKTTFNFRGPKIAYLDAEFKVSENATWEYYQTNSGIYAKNPIGSDSDPEEIIDARVTTIEEQIDSHKEAHEEASKILSGVNEDPEYMDDVVNSINTLKNSQMKSNAF